MSNFIDISKLQQLAYQQQVQASIANFTTETAEKAIQSLKSILTTPVMITNKFHPTPDQNGFYKLEISQKGFYLIEQKSTQKLSYKYSFDTQNLTINDSQVDQSFLVQFLNKIDKINTDLKSQKSDLFEKEGANHA